MQRGISSRPRPSGDQSPTTKQHLRRRTQQPQPQPSTKYDSPNTHTPSKYTISSNKNQIHRRPKKLRPRLPPFALNNASKRPSQEVALLSLPPFTLSTRTMPTRPCRPLKLSFRLFLGGDKSCSTSSTCPRHSTNLFASGSLTTSNVQRRMRSSAICATVKERPQEMVMSSRGFLGRHEWVWRVVHASPTQRPEELRSSKTLDSFSSVGSNHESARSTM